MRILFIQSTLERGGITSQLICLIPELIKLGHEPSILTLSTEPIDSEEKFFENLGVPVYKLGIKRCWPTFAIGILFKRILRQINPDIIQTSTLRPTVFSSKFGVGFKRVGVLQSDIIENYCDTYGSFLGRKFADAEFKAFKKLEGQVVVSRFLRDKFGSRLGQNLHIIPNGIPKPTVNPYPNLNEEKTYFLVAGLLIPRKNPELIINAFLKSKWSKTAQLRMAGKGPLLESLIEKYKEFPQIHFCGQLNSDELGKERSMASLYISASLSEGLPFSVIEALAWKLPCLLSDIPPHTELAALNDKGVSLFKSNSETDLIERLDALELAGNKVELRFPDAENMAKSYFNLYQSLLDNS
ncbi:MAG: glycosyltransferase family 4 protein [Bacteroidia bacterium]|nr:glycosyltransferase family 4 protein [Bacteroidia bacterium]